LRQKNIIQKIINNNRVMMKLKRLGDLREHFRSFNGQREQRQHSGKIHSVEFNCSGDRIASGSNDKTVVIYSLDRERITKEKTFYSHTGTVDQLKFSHQNPDLLATASGDRTLRIFDCKSHKNVSTINTKGENINMSWSRDNNTIAVGNKEDMITFIDTRTNKICGEEKSNFEVNEIIWNKRGDQLFLTSGHGCIHVLSYPDLEMDRVLKAHPATCICIDLDLSGKYFGVGGADAITSIWDADEMACIRVMSRLDWPVRTMSFSHDSRLLASASEDHLIDIACTETGERVCVIELESGTFSIAFHPKQYLLAYACDDKRDDGRELGNFKVFGFFE
jgi:THO complex subunit 3